MKTKTLAYIITVFSFAFIALSHSVPQIHAAGELKTTSKDGVMYITTETVTKTTTASALISSPSATTTANTGTQIVAPTGFAKNFGSVVNFVLQAIIVIAVLLVFGFLILGGIEWITSGGEKTKTESARNKIISAIVGLIVVASSYAIFLLILHFLGFTDLNDVINHVTPINTTKSTTTISTSSSQLKQQNLVQ